MTQPVSDVRPSITPKDPVLPYQQLLVAAFLKHPSYKLEVVPGLGKTSSC